MDGTTVFFTDRKLDKVFQMVLRNIALGNDIVHLILPLRQAVTVARTVPGIKRNLLSVNRLAAKNYIGIFDGDKLSICDATNTRVTVSR